jgi:hypothetical protein
MIGFLQRDSENLIDTRFLLSEAHRLAATMVAGDIVFNGSYFVAPKMHAEWITRWTRSLGCGGSGAPGPSDRGAKSDASALVFMKDYTLDFDQALESSMTAEEVQAKVKKRYPHLGGDAVEIELRGGVSG